MGVVLRPYPVLMAWVGDQVAAHWWTLYVLWLALCVAVLGRQGVPWLIGDDGLTRWERKRLARQYMATAGKMPTKSEFDALEARIRARREVDRETGTPDDPAIVSLFLTGRDG